MEAPKINSQALSILRSSIKENPLLSIALGAAIASVATFIFSQLGRSSCSSACLNKNVTDETNKKAKEVATPLVPATTTEAEEENGAGVNLQDGQGSNEELEVFAGNVGVEDQLQAQAAATGSSQDGSASDGDFE